MPSLWNNRLAAGKALFKNPTVALHADGIACMVAATREIEIEILKRFPRKGMVSMANTIETIPEKTRWEIATKGLTGAYIAISNALTQAVGQSKFEEFNGPLWRQAGKGAKEFAVTLGLATETAGDVEEVIHLLAKTSMGPEFQFEIVESTKDRCVGKTTECPWHKRWKEQGLDMDTCGAGHQAWGDGATESLNPNFKFRLTKNMIRGDSHCEWVVERKK